MPQWRTGKRPPWRPPHSQPRWPLRQWSNCLVNGSVDVTDLANADVVSASTWDLHTEAHLIEAVSAVYAAKYGSGYMDMKGEVSRSQCDTAADTFM